MKRTWFPVRKVIFTYHTFSCDKKLEATRKQLGIIEHLVLSINISIFIEDGSKGFVGFFSHRLFMLERRAPSFRGELSLGSRWWILTIRVSWAASLQTAPAPLEMLTIIKGILAYQWLQYGLFRKLISHQQKKAVRQEKAMRARPPSRARTAESDKGCRPGLGSFVPGSSGPFVLVSSSVVGSTVEGSNIEGSTVGSSVTEYKNSNS